jgi:hypothetical protein
MRIQFNLSSLRQTKWSEYAVRFIFGGAITVAAGLLAKRFGPIFGGLFLAFPAIFPATATLVEKHEKEKRQKAELSTSLRGRQAAAVEARGTVLGSFALAAFAWMVWKILPNLNGPWTLAAALSGWFALSVAIWSFRKRLRFTTRPRQSRRPEQ